MGVDTQTYTRDKTVQKQTHTVYIPCHQKNRNTDQFLKIISKASYDKKVPLEN